MENIKKTFREIKLFDFTSFFGPLCNVKFRFCRNLQSILHRYTKDLAKPKMEFEKSSSICDYCIFNSCFVMSMSIRKKKKFSILQLRSAASIVKRISREND